MFRVKTTISLASYSNEWPGKYVFNRATALQPTLKLCNVCADTNIPVPEGQDCNNYLHYSHII